MSSNKSEASRNSSGSPERESSDNEEGSPTPPRESSGDEYERKKSDALQTLSPSDKQRFIAANRRREEDDRKMISAQSHLVQVRSEFQRIKAQLDKAQGAYDKARASSQEHSEQDADDLLLEPTEWNSRYLQLRAHFDKEGHSHLKRNIADADVKGMTEDEASELRALSRWTTRQRKFKRNGDLDHYKVLLMDRL